MLNKIKYTNLSGALHDGIDEAVFSIAPLPEWADRDELPAEADG